jgi:hypothetical protein
MVVLIRTIHAPFGFNYFFQPKHAWKIAVFFERLVLKPKRFAPQVFWGNLRNALRRRATQPRDLQPVRSN